jgi:Raf kinase inhibitor-like YbhB/YbcL family protein
MNGGANSFVVALVFMALAFSNPSTAADASAKGGLQLSSSAFKDGSRIPDVYTCAGKNVSPPLNWSGVPAQARSLALIVEDPDAPAGIWTHWVLFDLSPTVRELAEDLPKGQNVAGNAKQGLNDFKHLGYGGPCPPAGKEHRYFFKFYALDKMLELKPGSGKKQVEKTLDGHVLAQGQLIGTYSR